MGAAVRVEQLADDPSTELAEILGEHEPATTNRHLYRLSRSVVSARGNALTGSSRAGASARRTAMAEIADAQRVSTLGAEAAAAAEHLGAALCVWEGDDGPGIRCAVGPPYRSVVR